MAGAVKGRKNTSSPPPLPPPALERRSRRVLIRVRVFLYYYLETFLGRGCHLRDIAGAVVGATRNGEVGGGKLALKCEFLIEWRMKFCEFILWKIKCEKGG